MHTTSSWDFLLHTGTSDGGCLTFGKTSQQSQEQFHAQPSVTPLLSGEPSPRFDDVGHNVLRFRADTLGTNPNFTEGSQNI